MFIALPFSGEGDSQSCPSDWIIGSVIMLTVYRLVELKGDKFKDERTGACSEKIGAYCKRVTNRVRFAKQSLPFFLPSATKLRRLCFYTCLSFCSQGEVPGHVSHPLTRYIPSGPGTPPGTYTPCPGPGTPPRTRYTPWAGTPPLGPGTPQDQVQPPGTRYTPQQAHPIRTRYTPWAGTPPGQVHPLGRYTPWDQVHPPPPGTRYTPWTRYTLQAGIPPMGPGTPWQVHPLGPGTPPGTKYTPQD